KVSVRINAIIPARVSWFLASLQAWDQDHCRSLDSGAVPSGPVGFWDRAGVAGGPPCTDATARLARGRKSRGFERSACGIAACGDRQAASRCREDECGKPCAGGPSRG